MRAVNILFAAGAARWPEYRAPLQTALTDAGLTFDLRTDLPPEEVDYIIYAPDSTVQDFTPYHRLKAVLNLWAGVETVVTNPTLTVPLTRMVDDALERGMVEWVTGHTLRHHLGMDRHIFNPRHVWDPVAPPLARDRPVTILGLGALGSACARALCQLGFPVTGWSRTPRTIAGVSCKHGTVGLQSALETAQILILLLPSTKDTENILSARSLSMLPQGAVIVNPGRGALIDDDALLAALETGEVAHATLDAFRTEPLPADHPFWHHRQVTVTPHIASTTRPDSASQVIAENIRRGENGNPFLFLVNREQGY